MTDLNEAFEKRWRAQPWDTLVSEGTDFKEVGRIMFREGLKEAKGTPTKADAPFTRDELQLIRDRAQHLYDVTVNTFWQQAYGSLADAADYLDAMMARSEVPNFRTPPHDTRGVYGGGPVAQYSGKPWWSGLMYGNSTAFMEDPRATLTITAMCASCKEKVSLVEPVPPACPLCGYDGEKK